MSSNHDTHHANDSRLVEQVQLVLAFVRSRPTEWAGQVEDLIARHRSGNNMQTCNIYVKDSLSYAETASNTGFSPDDPLKSISQALVAGSAFKRVRILLLSSCFLEADLDFFNNKNVIIQLRGYTLGFKQVTKSRGGVVQGTRSYCWYNIGSLGIELGQGNITYSQAIYAVSSPHYSYGLKCSVFRGSGHGFSMDLSITGSGRVACVDALGNHEIPGVQKVCSNYNDGATSGSPYGKQSWHSTNVVYAWARSISATQKVTELLAYPKSGNHYNPSYTGISGYTGNLTTILGITNPIRIDYSHDTH